MNFDPKMDTVTGWKNFFEEVVKLLSEGERQYGLANRNYTDYTLERLELCLTTCTEIRNLVQGHPELAEVMTLLRELIDCIRVLYRKWDEYADVLDSSTVPTRTSYQANTNASGLPGRPPFRIQKEQLEYLSSLGFSWTEVAALIGVSRMTIYRRRVDYGLIDDPSAEISDSDLKAEIEGIRHDAPFSGVSIIKVTRERIRSTLRLLDPLGSALRWPSGLTRRRPYSVAGPNSLWHIDSHHKLIRWRLVTHGGIDGYSRLITFLQCSSNNKASTMFELFLSAVQKFQLPSRVRSDQGTENIAVARYMIEKRGAERNSMITGSSVHNQRIERLWKDMHKCVTLLYYKLFYFLEHHAILDPLNEHNLWALHYVFIPRINRGLKEFVNSWNHHPLRTAGHKSPQQLFTAGCLILQHSQLASLDFFENVDEDYGVDYDGPVTAQHGIEVPQISLRFSDDDVENLRTHIDPCALSDNFGIDIYERTLNFISTLQPL